MKHLIFVALYASIIMTLELLTSSLPNVSLTPLLFAVYFKTQPRSFILIAVYIGLQMLVWGFGFYLISMAVGWLLLYGLVHLVNNDLWMVVLSVPFAFIYGWVFMPLSVVLYGIDPVAYLIADIPYQIVMAMSNVLTFAILYTPLKKLLEGEYGKIRTRWH